MTLQDANKIIAEALDLKFCYNWEDECTRTKHVPGCCQSVPDFTTPDLRCRLYDWMAEEGRWLSFEVWLSYRDDVKYLAVALSLPRKEDLIILIAEWIKESERWRY